MATLKDFEPYVSLDVSGCPSAVIRQALMLAVEDFCRRSRAWRAECPAGNLQEGVSLYTIVPPTGAAVCSLEWLEVGGRKQAEGSFVLEAGAVRLANLGPAGAAIVAKSILAPLKTAATVPDLLLEHTEGIASGAKFRLMLQPGKPWSSPELAAYHKRAFEDAIGDAFVRSETGGVIGSLTVKPRAFGS